MGGAVRTGERAPGSPTQAALRSLLSRPGIFSGIGPARARELVERFGKGLHDRILTSDRELYDVLPEAIAAGLIVEYPDHAQEVELARWLDAVSANRALACSILSSWGAIGAETLRRNPYLLISWGETWNAVDRVGQHAGIRKNDPRRLIGALEAALAGRRSDGHTWTEEKLILQLAAELHSADIHHENAVIELGIADGVLTSIGNGIQGIGSAIMERQIAIALTKDCRQADLFSVPTAGTPSALIANYSGLHSGMTLDAAQQAAVMLPLTSRAAVIAGYAGTGKTTVLSVIFEVLRAAGLHPQPMALAGRAARRLPSVNGVQPRTIASVLHQPVVRERRPNGRVVKRPFSDRDVLVIDEASMVDIASLWELIRKTGDARILMVGDPAQLPPIGAGKPFVDALDKIPTVTLERIYRQAAKTGIPKAAADIRNGNVPDMSPSEKFAGGVSFVHATLAETPATLQKIYRKLSYDIEEDEIQILSSQRKTVAGTNNINRIFSSLNGADRPSFPGVENLRQGDPVIFVKNDIQRELSNGSMGRYLGGRDVLIEGRVHLLNRAGDERRIEPAYAMTVHKSQGSEWRRVIFIVHPGRLLDRSLIYTAVTRAAEQVVVIGDYKAFAEAVQAENAATQRETALVEYIDVARRYK